MLNHITEIDVVIRLSLAFAAGAIIGFERSSRRQVAGLRTHVLIAVGAACLMLLSIWIPQHFFEAGDPGRIAAQVVTGMGFLGAGAIIRLGNDVKGLTTAASLWVIAAIGMTIGAGMYIAAAVTEVIALLTLVLLNKIERKIFPEIRNKIIEVHYNHCNDPDTDSIMEVFKHFSVRNRSANIYPGHDDIKTKAKFFVSVLDTLDTSKLAKAIKLNNDIEHIEIEEKY